ncbi:hypothetical protein [Mesorhizobium carmichaelinearum]|uniref:hypothetical protein n=1 Tax=Mesorhizobium carmichaelinearum TaxID=1208188 RepID=UPI000BA3871A|nr:hypothetical protein [Mesorhizobium carmichaelinearum]
MHTLLPAIVGGILLNVQLVPDKTVHDADNGFSLTFPGNFPIERPTGGTTQLQIGGDGLICQVSTSRYNASAPIKFSDPKKFIEKGWSNDDWRDVIGAAYSTADFSNQGLQQFPSGYAVRLTDIDFTLGDKKLGLHGHSRIALSIRGSRFGYVNCTLMGKSAEDVLSRWIWIVGPIEKIVRSFVLDPA